MDKHVVQTKMYKAMNLMTEAWNILSEIADEVFEGGNLMSDYRFKLTLSTVVKLLDAQWFAERYVTEADDQTNCVLVYVSDLARRKFINDNIEYVLKLAQQDNGIFKLNVQHDPILDKDREVLVIDKKALMEKYVAMKLSLDNGTETT